jgi:hypothetical protein
VTRRWLRKKGPVDALRDSPAPTDGSVGGGSSRAEGAEMDIRAAMGAAFAAGESPDPQERKKAIQAYADVVERDPTNHVAQFNMAVVLSRVGNWRQAVRIFEQAQHDPELYMVAAYAKLRLMIENGQEPADADLPPEFRGDKRGILGVQGACCNVANELRNRGYTCTLEPDNRVCFINCQTPAGDYMISVKDWSGILLWKTDRVKGDMAYAIDSSKRLSKTDRELSTIEISILPLAQLPVPRGTEASDRPVDREAAEAKTGVHGGVTMPLPGQPGEIELVDLRSPEYLRLVEETNREETPPETEELLYLLSHARTWGESHGWPQKSQYPEYADIRAIGQRLDAAGGKPAMQRVYLQVQASDRQLARLLSPFWHLVGKWQD